MKDFILPIIAFFVGLISLYIDSKERTKKWIFISCLLITVITTIIFNVFESKKNEASLIAAKNKERELLDILSNITSNTKQIPDIVEMLKDFGFTTENAENATPKRINNALNANKIFKEYVSEINSKSASQVQIDYYPKDVDGPIIFNAFEDAGFKINRKTPFNNLKTNAIWAGDSVTIAEIKVVALILIRSGVEIITIERFKSNKEIRSKLIQVGTDPTVLKKPALKLQEIEELNI